MRTRAVSRDAVLLLVYVVAMWVGRETRPEGSQVSLVWPAAGVGVWWLLQHPTWRRAALPATLLLLCTVLMNRWTGAAWDLAAAYGAVNVVHAALGAALVRRALSGGSALREPGEVMRLLAACLAVGVVSGTLVTVALAALADASAWPTWALVSARNGGTTFVVLAVLLSLRRTRGDAQWVRRPVETALVCCAAGVLVTWLFLTDGGISTLFLALAVPVWSGVRLGRRTSALLSAVVGVVAVVGTVIGTGAFAVVSDEAARAALVQCFTVLVMVTSQALATLQESRDTLAAELAASRDRLAEASDAAVIGKAVVVRGTDGGWVLRDANPALVVLLGRDPSTLRWRELLDPDDARRTRRALDEIAHGTRTRWDGEVRHLRPDGTPVWTQVHVSLMSAPNGRTTVVAQVLDVTERRAAQERLAFLAHHDPLTGLLNRRRLVEELDTVLADRRNGGVAVLFCDLDRFKDVNDTLGHEAGDLVLRLVATRLRSTLRPQDATGRLGGDEFVAVCPGVPDAAVADMLADRVRGALAPALADAAPGLPVGASIGAVVAVPGDDAASLLRRADSAMYEVKRAHRRPPGVPAPR
ncbi:diguanylate cyclase domain-containing protein [Aquipuribacter nitratireducens]|uniref:Diguanylate cyclase domain-containing protein n=1 Tax=Aquipuribacter nitratireducens TaxID=650104 RepID=A0ABW0GN87_9MICO